MICVIFLDCSFCRNKRWISNSQNVAFLKIYTFWSKNQKQAFNSKLPKEFAKNVSARGGANDDVLDGFLTKSQNFEKKVKKMNKKINKKS